MNKSSINNPIIKGVIFDFDGVIVDSEPLWERADRIIVKQEGKGYHAEAKNIIMGLNPVDSINELRRIHNISTSPEILLKKRENLMRRFYENVVELNSGAYEILEYLYENGIKIALASSTPKRLFLNALKKFKIDRFFEVIVTSEDVRNSKPDPEIFIKAGKMLGIPKNNIIVVEDSRAGVRAAIAAGMMVFWFKNTSADIKGLFPDYVINSLTEMRLFFVQQSR